MSFQSLSDSDKEIVSAIHHLILANWVEAAAIAWVSYEAHGRGAVLVDFRPHDTPPQSLPFAGYVRQQDLAANNPDLDQLRELLIDYDPEQAVVFVIYTPLGDTIFEKISTLDDRPTPPDAAVQTQ